MSENKTKEADDNDKGKNLITPMVRERGEDE